MPDLQSQKSSLPLESDPYRLDIQALRGLAITLVLIYHAELLPVLHAGFLGVDIFFVVSGFLITGIIQRQILSGRFSLREFYFRRAKRLLPAAYIVFSACAIAAPFFLGDREYRDFAWQLLGAVTFTGNIALWMQTGYFETSAQLKPLLHVWSLSIEEQYYLLLPFILLALPRRWWNASVVTAVGASLILCLLVVDSMPGATFFLLPTRAWELGLGSVGALMLTRESFAPLWRLLLWPSIGILAFIPFFPIEDHHPGFNAVLTCCATLIIILAKHPALNRGLIVAALAWIGNISYSLYLVHWPMLAFAENAWVSPMPWSVRLGIALLSILIAGMLYRYAENPVRQMPIPLSAKILYPTLACTILLGLSGFIFQPASPAPGTADSRAMRAPNYGMAKSCAQEGEFKPLPECQSSENPKIMLWGDSFAMHLAKQIEESNQRGLIQATKSLCGPVLQGSFFNQATTYNRNWAADCIRFNQSIFAHLAKSDSIEVVVLSTTAEQYLEDHTLLLAKPPIGTEDFGSGAFDTAHGSEDLATTLMVETIDRIRELGKRVVIIAPPPASHEDSSRCVERRSAGTLYFGARNPDCTLDRIDVERRRGPTYRLLHRVAQQSGTPLITFDEILCRAQKCDVELDGVPIYRDEHGHFSNEGAILIGRRSSMAELIWKEAK